MHLASCLLFAAILLLAGCGSSASTLFPVAEPGEPVVEYILDVPDHQEVQTVDFSAATDSSGVRGRGFVKVFATDRTTGEQVLLLFENIGVRKEPVALIRFE